MRPRVELALALGLLVVLGLLLIATRDKSESSQQIDSRRSTYLAGPQGAMALSEALQQMGRSVEHFRRRPSRLRELSQDSALFALLDPPSVIDPLEALQIATYGKTGGDLLLAGEGAAPIMACYGYAVDRRNDDSVRVTAPGERPGPHAAWTADMVLATVSDTAGAKPSSGKCAGTPVFGADTLLMTAGGRVAALRLHTRHNLIILVADGSLFGNRKVRDSDAGIFALGITAGYRRVIFDEYHQGFGTEGSLMGEVIAWSRASPWGWAAWQLMAVALLALLGGALRFGPTIRMFDPKRRSPMEHLRALATALASARGTDVAVALMVKGLRRRLSIAGQPNRGDVQEWLGTLGDNVRTERSRAAVRTLLSLTRRAPDAEGVLRAANAVEDVWQDLSLSRPMK